MHYIECCKDECKGTEWNCVCEKCEKEPKCYTKKRSPSPKPQVTEPNIPIIDVP